MKIWKDQKITASQSRNYGYFSYGFLVLVPDVNLRLITETSFYGSSQKEREQQQQQLMLQLHCSFKKRQKQNKNCLFPSSYNLSFRFISASAENFPKILARVSVSDVIEVDVDDDDRCNKNPVDLKAFRVALPSSSCGVTLANNRKEDKMALKEIKQFFCFFVSVRSPN